jgi:hypothetical protein
LPTPPGNLFTSLLQPLASANSCIVFLFSLFVYRSSRAAWVVGLYLALADALPVYHFLTVADSVNGSAVRVRGRLSAFLMPLLVFGANKQHLW